MTLFSHHSSQIALPDLLVNQKRIAGNLVKRYAFFGISVDATFFDSDLQGTYLVKTPLPEPYDHIYLQKPRQTPELPHNALCLKLKRVCSLEEITSETEFQWLQHPLSNSSATPEEITAQWQNQFLFKEESGESDSYSPGLRKPQLGALYAISSFLTLSDTKPVTAVLPTGTGKTETMLAVLVSARILKLMVVVPSDALRVQIANKFLSLGFLPEAGIVKSTCLLPSVGLINTGIKNTADAIEFAENCNVIVATASVLNACSSKAQKALANQCSHLFIDEAHHVAAKIWRQTRELFVDKKVIQFTATPFRSDGQNLDGRIIYNYTMKEAQEAGYFKPIQLLPVEEYYNDYADESIAAKAVEQLRSDLGNGFDHLILARTQKTKSTSSLLKVYQKLAPEFSPVVVHTNMPKKHNDWALRQIYNRQSRIIICVDMFGEGFDLPNLKIAAVHDYHKSLAVTLQFIGRFTRNSHSQQLGKASVVLNIADVSVQKKLQQLYAQDANWDNLLQRLSREAVDREVALQEVIDSLKTEGDLHKNISLWNLRPGCTVVLHKTYCQDWKPDQFTRTLTKGQWYKHAISRDQNILVLMIQRRTEVRWGKFEDIRDHTFALLIAHWDKDRNGLFIFASDYKAFRWEALAKEICGDDVEVITGKPIFRVFNNVEYPLVRNLGAARDGTISFTQYFGPNVTEGLAEVEKSSSNLSNIAGWGYQNGDKINWGCSQKKGKVWSVKNGTIPEWLEWCQIVWDKVTDESTDCTNITENFLKPEALDRRHDCVAVAVEWGEYIQRAFENQVTIKQGAQESLLYDVSINLMPDDGTQDLQFSINSKTNCSIYRIVIGGEAEYCYELLDGPAVSIKKGGGVFKDITEYVKVDPIIFRYVDTSFSYNNFLVKISEKTTSYPVDGIQVWNWNGINISNESMGHTQLKDSVQFATWQRLASEYEIILNDDEAGEAADLVGMSFNTELNEITLGLIHCKYSSSAPGARVGDLYEVCGQAQKSIVWKHRPFSRLIDHLRIRNDRWRQQGKGSRIIKGDIQQLVAFKKLGQTAKINLEVFIVQPGISKSKTTDAMLKVLGSTEIYLAKTASARLTVIGSA